VNIPALLVRLYPPAIRQRWGNEIEHETRLAGPRWWVRHGRRGDEVVAAPE